MAYELLQALHGSVRTWFEDHAAKLVRGDEVLGSPLAMCAAFSAYAPLFEWYTEQLVERAEAGGVEVLDLEAPHYSVEIEGEDVVVDFGDFADSPRAEEALERGYARLLSVTQEALDATAKKSRGFWEEQGRWVAAHVLFWRYRDSNTGEMAEFVEGLADAAGEPISGYDADTAHLWNQAIEVLGDCLASALVVPAIKELDLSLEELERLLGLRPEEKEEAGVSHITFAAAREAVAHLSAADLQAVISALEAEREEIEQWLDVWDEASAPAPQKAKVEEQWQRLRNMRTRAEAARSLILHRAEHGTVSPERPTSEGSAQAVRDAADREILRKGAPWTKGKIKRIWQFWFDGDGSWPRGFDLLCDRCKDLDISPPFDTHTSMRKAFDNKKRAEMKKGTWVDPAPAQNDNDR